MQTEIKPVCVLLGPIATRSGYGDHCRQIATALIKQDKFDLKIISTRWGGTPMTALDSNEDPIFLEIKKRFLTANLTVQPEVLIQVSIPNEFQPQAKFNIGITAGIETTAPKPEWIEGLNRMDLNIVPSVFARDVFQKAAYVKKLSDGREEQVKLTKPMEIAFEGVDTSVYKKTDEPSAELDISLDAIPESFNFLFVGHWLQGDLGADRKDVGMLIKIFTEVFKNKKTKPGLILKTSGSGFSHIDKTDILKKINMIRSSVSGVDLPNIYLIHGDLTLKEMNRLYNHSKVKAHISLTHGEGFGRPLLEASLSGKPIIATNWSGHVDFLPADTAIMLPGTLAHVPPTAVNEWIVKEGQWFVANYSVAAQKMDDVFTNYLKYIPNAERLRAQNSEKFTLEAGNKVLTDIIDKYLPKFERKVQIVLPKFKKIEKPVA